jgi:hypothetical protein
MAMEDECKSPMVPVHSPVTPSSAVSPSSEQWETARTKLNECYNRYQVCLSFKVMNVHSFNSHMKWAEVLPALIKIDTELLGSDDSLTYQSVGEKIKSSDPYRALIEKDRNNFDREFLKLTEHLSKNVIEPAETRIDVQKLLSRIWSLSNNFGFLPEDHIIHDSDSAIGFLITSIKTNIFEGGGCYPGYAGRLALNYLLVLQAKICFSDELLLL